MVGKEYKFHDGEKGSALAIRVMYGRGESSFVKVRKDGAVVIKLGPGKEDLNTRLLAFISRELGIPRARIQVLAGNDGNNKLISILDMKPKLIQKKILERID
jgi:uncharacterized protein YggU (UPF0235/DUF167 family)